MLKDAASELENILPELKTHPEVLAFRIKLCLAAEKWDLATEMARHMVQVDPHRPQW